ncbi:PWI domain-containing protein [Lachnellula suecica]|uniref:PWI domain-containing protein n=1 Tax=Lachnellula suecica TaxID=602035 RepID=A0A8T9BRH3_9HELO|nr:PWI domain-containing protein [Lachnellula suecica]
MASSVDAKLLKATKFPPEFTQKVDMQKVNVEVMKKWIAGKIAEILKNDDDVVIELCYNLMEGSRFPDIKNIQIQLTGFLDKDTAPFCKELWKLCLSAQSNPQGVPKELLEAKKLELIQEKIESDKAAEAARQRRNEDERREREMNNVRARERGDRGRGGFGRGGDSWRGGRGGRMDDRNRDFGRGNDREFGRGNGRDFERRGPRYSRSPPRRRPESRDIDPYRREADTYVPRGRGGPRREASRRAPQSGSPRLRGLPRILVLPPHDIAVAPRPEPHRLLLVGAALYQVRQTDVKATGAGEEGGEEEAPIAELVEDHQLHQSPLVLHPLSAEQQHLILRLLLLGDRVTGAPDPGACLHLPEDPVVILRLDHDLLQFRDRVLPVVFASREKTATSPTPADDIEKRTTTRKDRERRLTRSRSRSVTPPRRRRRSPSRSRSRGARDRKRRRSLERFEPANKRRRNTSSVSSPVDTRNRSIDKENDAEKGSPRREVAIDDAGPAVPTEMKAPQRQASELREKLLREKIKKMRKSSIDAVNAQANL